ncbi:MAG: hypothetical protein ABI877_23735 [Gemmatimonadaceae bacterium]
MPERGVEVQDVMLRIAWNGESVSTRGQLRLSDHEVQVEVGDSRIRIGYDAIHGAHLRAGTLTLFSEHGTIAASESPGLELLWVELQARACVLPELTVGLRALGSRRGGNPELQGRFFAPLLSARRRLEEQLELEWRLAAFDADDLHQRTGQVLRELVAERASATPSARRSLEAQAFDEAEGLQAALGALGMAADALRVGDDETRFGAWREWSARARDVFVQADRCWLAVWPLLERSTVPRRGPSRGTGGPGRAAGGLAFIIGASYFGIR